MLIDTTLFIKWLSKKNSMGFRNRNGRKKERAYFKHRGYSRSKTRRLMRKYRKYR